MVDENDNTGFDYDKKFRDILDAHESTRIMDDALAHILNVNDETLRKLGSDQELKGQLDDMDAMIESAKRQSDAIKKRHDEVAMGATMAQAVLGDDVNVTRMQTPTEAKAEEDKKNAAELAAKEAEDRKKILAEAMDDLDGLVGLDSVKEQVRENQATIQAALVRKNLGLIDRNDSEADDMNLHLVLTGNPGTGKTTVARIYAKILKGLGILKTGQLIETDRSGLVAGYQGQTAPQTNKVVDSALGGVLFIDEVYNLINGDGKDDTFGNEAVATLMKRMEDDRDKFVVIVAGYTDLTERFLDANPGLRSRFVEKIEFPDYTNEELVEITELKARGKGLKLTDDNKKQLLESYARLRETSAFANGRTARVLLDNAVKAQSIRFSKEITEHPNMSDEDKRSILTTLTEDDIKKATAKTIDVSTSKESEESKAKGELEDLMKTMK